MDSNVSGSWRQANVQASMDARLHHLSHVTQPPKASNAHPSVRMGRRGKHDTDKAGKKDEATWLSGPSVNSLKRPLHHQIRLQFTRSLLTRFVYLSTKSRPANQKMDGERGNNLLCDKVKEHWH